MTKSGEKNLINYIIFTTCKFVVACHEKNVICDSTFQKINNNNNNTFKLFFKLKKFMACKFVTSCHD